MISLSLHNLNTKHFLSSFYEITIREKRKEKKMIDRSMGNMDGWIICSYLQLSIEREYSIMMMGTKR